VDSKVVFFNPNFIFQNFICSPSPEVQSSLEFRGLNEIMLASCPLVIDVIKEFDLQSQIIILKVG
jgi:hypothetical protein